MAQYCGSEDNAEFKKTLPFAFFRLQEFFWLNDL